MSVPSIPTSYSHDLNPNGPLDIELDVDGNLNSNINASHSGTLNTNLSGGVDTRLSGDLSTDSVLTLKGDPKSPVSTDSKVEIMNLPRFTLQDIKDMMKVRVRIPNYSNICFKVMGVELMSLCMGGESQVITEPYVPNAAERCETDCCEPDTRPFPERQDGAAKPVPNRKTTTKS